MPQKGVSQKVYEMVGLPQNSPRLVTMIDPNRNKTRDKNFQLQAVKGNENQLMEKIQ